MQIHCKYGQQGFGCVYAYTKRCITIVTSFLNFLWANWSDVLECWMRIWTIQELNYTDLKADVWVPSERCAKADVMHTYNCVCAWTYRYERNAMIWERVEEMHVCRVIDCMHVCICFVCKIARRSVSIVLSICVLECLYCEYVNMRTFRYTKHAYV